MESLVWLSGFVGDRKQPKPTLSSVPRRLPTLSAGSRRLPRSARDPTLDVELDGRASEGDAVRNLNPTLVRSTTMHTTREPVSFSSVSIMSFALAALLCTGGSARAQARASNEQTVAASAYAFLRVSGHNCV